MPAHQIQYSEKYYDEIYEVNTAEECWQRLPRALDADAGSRGCCCWPCGCTARSPSCRCHHSLGCNNLHSPERCWRLQYRHVVLPQDVAALVPKGHLLSEVGRAALGTCCHSLCAQHHPPGESFSCHLQPISPTAPSCVWMLQAEWRALGVQQSRGWVSLLVMPSNHAVVREALFAAVDLLV